MRFGSKIADVILRDVNATVSSTLLRDILGLYS